ncbi:DUF2971 domain-containing protein [Paenibacillus dendritiformis]|uniref:DUF2971 domain-containing protein n=1 Tax=Paenibacillus dendritiformis C454 TaxID=1131935 RepID=H3S9G0_9BACL|nr:DUF2971 domain-containing protein [Paenibacillus dendritiformis]EHQ64408.1 hypothetical protein PDENDC454_00800 [Paenibacillus dendritiformis C454]CAH8770377.1 DUF2971 domain-containing protein [Paenibacillus dendritiformis]
MKIILWPFIAKLDSNFTKEHLDQLATSMRDIFQNEHDTTINDFKNMILNSTYVSCFSETNNSILMWSHYAALHKGFCIEYDFKSLGLSDPRVRMLHPVIYRDEMFDLSNFVNLNTLNNQSVNIYFAIYAAMVNSSVWSYEKEWRLIISNGILENAGSYTVPKPLAIYLEVKVIDQDKNKLVEIANQKRNLSISNEDEK